MIKISLWLRKKRIKLQAWSKAKWLNFKKWAAPRALGLIIIAVLAAVVCFTNIDTDRIIGKVWNAFKSFSPRTSWLFWIAVAIGVLILIGLLYRYWDGFKNVCKNVFTPRVPRAAPAAPVGTPPPTATPATFGLMVTRILGRTVLWSLAAFLVGNGLAMLIASHTHLEYSLLVPQYSWAYYLATILFLLSEIWLETGMGGGKTIKDNVVAYNCKFLAWGAILIQSFWMFWSTGPDIDYSRVTNVWEKVNMFMQGPDGWPLVACLVAVFLLWLFLSASSKAAVSPDVSKTIWWLLKLTAFCGAMFWLGSMLLPKIHWSSGNSSSRTETSTESFDKNDWRSYPIRYEQIIGHEWQPIWTPENYNSKEFYRHIESTEDVHIEIGDPMRQTEYKHVAGTTATIAQGRQIIRITDGDVDFTVKAYVCYRKK